MFQTGAMVGKEDAKEEIVRFNYPPGPDGSLVPAGYDWPVESKTSEECSASLLQTASEQDIRAAFDHRLAEETRLSFEAGRERGRGEGRQPEREAHASATATEQEHRVRQAANLIDTFNRERDRYLQLVEGEVVNLALAVAARILRRESQMDPMLLTGAVRVALGQLAASTRVLLRVPSEDLDMWSESIALLPNLTVKPEVVAGNGMRLGDCVLETEMGSVDLGWRAQLAEIERGFFDGTGVVKADSRRSTNGSSSLVQERRL